MKFTYFRLRVLLSISIRCFSYLWTRRERPITLLTFRLRFGDNQVRFDSNANVAFGPTQHPQLIGRATLDPAAVPSNATDDALPSGSG
jgi:hypothetical protein